MSLDMKEMIGKEKNYDTIIDMVYDVFSGDRKNNGTEYDGCYGDDYAAAKEYVNIAIENDELTGIYYPEF